MAPMHTRYCVACEEEFRPEIVHCSDCGGELEDRWETESPGLEPVAAEPEPSRPQKDYTAVFHAVDSGSLGRAAARLARADIAFTVTPGFDLMVLHEDSEAAMEILRGRAGAVSMPAGTDSAIVEGRCPACDGHVPDGSVECPECQLVVGNDQSFCESCRSVLDTDDEKCRECGAARGA
jgi:predicted amidophosphoribosyltransferase